MTNTRAPIQWSLDLGVEIEKDVGGIEMGVLDNGIPYLTQRGLASVSGAARSSLYNLNQDWEKSFDDPLFTRDKISFLRERLLQQGYDERKLYIEFSKDGSPHYAYPDIVCMAIIEYFAFEHRTRSEKALDSFRKFSSYGLRTFIYDALKYKAPDKWRYQHDRASILQNSVPPGFFSIFHEITGLVVDLIEADVAVNERTIPDISIGTFWSSYWKSNDFSDTYGERIKFDHNYPNYYPQALSNPQEVWAYPEESLPAFRKWFRETYLPTKFPAYILKKAGMLSGGISEAKRIASIFSDTSKLSKD